MQFFYHKDAGSEAITLDSQSFHYLFRVRRFDTKQILKVRNLVDKYLYYYKYDKKSRFILYSVFKAPKNLESIKINLILAMIDPKDIYDTLPFLNALNVGYLSLFYADFSQKNRSISMEKAMKILSFSCMQCGRIDMMKIDIFKDLDSIFHNFKNANIIDFICFENLNKIEYLESLDDIELKNVAKSGIIIGAEGGFSERERQSFKEKKIYTLKPRHILTSHLASIYIASVITSN